MIQKVFPSLHNTLCSKKCDAKIQFTITMAYLITIRYPLIVFNYHLSDVNVVNFNKIHHIVCEQQLFKRWNSKTKFPIWKIAISLHPA